MAYPFPPKENNEFNEQDYLKCGSSTDCTGLIPSAALDDDEFESYRELYSFLPTPPENEQNDMK